VFDKAAGLWTVTVENGKSYTARVLVCADGAPSALATKLGYVTEPPQGVCSRAYIKSDRHNFDADGVVFYNRGLLPGYAALFRHPTNEVNYCCYIIPGETHRTDASATRGTSLTCSGAAAASGLRVGGPGNPDVTNDKLSLWHHKLMAEVRAVTCSGRTRAAVAGTLTLHGTTAASEFPSLRIHSSSASSAPTLIQSRTLSG